ncbi:hypothetical protein [Sphingomonas paucimobilis]|uniref:hypothetical protein n=1 Tax=Sphingomonas paucimobilis TaxID=13689 RepID=UPI001600FDC7|nr:hypothetical protein [Sphingomonas paucimobilis]
MLGRTGTAGDIVARFGWDTRDAGDNDRQGFVSVLSLGPVAAIEGQTVDRSPVTYSNGAALGAFAGFMWSMTQVGALASPVLGFGAGAGTPPGWSAQHGLSGKAAATWTLRFDTKAKLYQNGVPAPMWTVRGILAYDPRKDSTYPGGNGPHRMADPADTAAYDAATTTWEWTEDPYLLGLRWAHGFWQRDPRDPNSKYQRVMGIGAPWGAIDVASFVEGANVAQANGWTCGGVVYSGDGKWDTMKKVLQAGMGEPLALGARISCFVNAPKVSLATVTIDDVVGAASVAATQPRRDRINTITPSFRLEANAWQHLPGAPISVPEHVAEDGGKRARAQDYWLIQNAKQVGTAVRYDIENAREFGPITLPVKLHWMGYKPGDCVTAVLPELGLNGQPILLLNRTLGAASGIVTLSARSETAAKHAFALGQTATPPPTPGVSGPPVVPVPAQNAWAITATSLISQAQTVPALVVSGSVDASTADAVVIEYRPFVSGQSVDAGWTSAGVWSVGASRAEITSVRSSTAYEVAISYQRNGLTGGRRIIGPVVTAGPSIDYDGVTGPNRPENGATVGAPAGTMVGNMPVEIVIHQIEQIEPIKTDVSALQQVTIEHDAALGALGRVDEAQAAALEKLEGDTGRSLAVLDAAGVRRDAAQRDAEDALGRIGEATLRALMEADRTRAVLRNAGVVVDPATGVVRIHAIDQVADRTSVVEVKLDAQANTIRSKASVDFVQEQIALAVLDPSQVAELEPLIRRMTTAETVLDGLRGTVALKADALELTRTVARLTSVSQTLDALAGTVDTKANRTDLDAQGLRLTNAEQRIAALPNGASITVTLRQVGAASDAAGEAALRGMVASDEAGRALIREIAEYREEAIARIDTGLAAESLARRALAASMGGLDARLTDQVRTLVTTTTATAERVAALAVSSGAQAAAIGSLEEAAIDAAGGIARTERIVRQVAGVADANAEATLRALIAGDSAALAAQTQLAQAHEETTTRLIVGERSAAQTKLLLEAQLGAARALIGQTAETLATADRAAASRMDAIDVRVGAVSDGVAATQARITREVDALASADAAQVRQIDAVALEVRDPGTGLVATRAMAIADAQASVERDKVQVGRIDAIGVVAADAAAGIAEAREVSAAQGRGMTRLSTVLRQTAGQADDGAEAVLRALVAGDDASRAGQRQIVQIQTELSTQLVAGEQASAIARQALAARMGRAEGAIVDLTKVVSTLDAATAQRLTALEVAFAAQGREIISTVARIAREEDARAAGDHAEALARQTLEARVDGVAGDVGDVRAAIGDEARVRAAADDAEASARQTLQAEVGGIAKDVTAVAASIGDEARVRAQADHAEAEARRVLAAQVNDPNTGLAAAMAQIGAVDRARVSGDEASAEMVRQVRAYLDGIGSVGLQQAFEALVTRTGKLEGRYTLAIDTNGRWQGFVLAGSQNGPASFSLIDTDFLMGNGKIVFNTGTYMKVQGVGFGAAKDLIEWYGPTMAIDKCSRANALEYRTTTGDAYYGGSLSAGTLRNPGQSSSLAADAVAEVTPFGSNGKPVRYIASWSYYSQYERTFSADAQGVKLFEQAVEASGATSDDGGYYYYGLKNIERPTSTITLTRAFAGAASQKLDQRSFTTEQMTFRGLKPTPGDAPGRATYTETIGGGFTVTDPVQSTADRALKLTLSRGLTFSEGVIQRLSIIAVEE